LEAEKTLAEANFAAAARDLPTAFTRFGEASWERGPSSPLERSQTA
jgi:hypothetical protein